ncbi:MAG: FAD-linked oxidase C-terminal domain-containing protein [Pseudomonadota bacterium]
MEKAQVIERLQALLPTSAIISDAAGCRPYESDGLTAIRQLPWLVVLPETEAQVVAVVKLCAELDLPLVARGAGTGLSGGARPHEQGILLGLSRLNRILELDPARAVARVEPGVRNLAITEAAAEHGLYYAPDPSSQIACSIGGNVAENSGGVHCLKYGLTVHNVTGVRAVTASGEVLTLGGATLDDAGYDLLALLCGSEGMLAVITEITVRLLPAPAVRQVLLAAFSDVAAAADAVSVVIADGIVPAGLEMMDRLAIEAAEDFVQAGYPRDAAAILLCELDGVPEEVATDAQRVQALFERSGATHVEVAVDPAAQARLWLGRKAAFPAVGRIAPDYYCMDGTIPRAELAGVLGTIARLSERYGLQVANVFHAGDGNLHPLILYDANVPGQLEKAEAFGGEILKACVAAGGTITGEHGVGVEKLDGMCAQFSQAELEQFERVRAALDPQAILNPGKGIPTLARCSEVGGMHVHGGRAPFGAVPRF